MLCRRVPASTGNDRGQVEPVRRTVASVILFDSGGTSLEESGSSSAIAACGMRQADADRREPLPQVRCWSGPAFQRASRTSCDAKAAAATRTAPAAAPTPVQIDRLLPGVHSFPWKDSAYDHAPCPSTASSTRSTPPAATYAASATLRVRRRTRHQRPRDHRTQTVLSDGRPADVSLGEHPKRTRVKGSTT